MEYNTEYNSEPVIFCKQCLSLNIRSLPDLMIDCYCGDCGSTEFLTASIYTWQQLFKEKYGYDFLTGEKDI